MPVLLTVAALLSLSAPVSFAHGKAVKVKVAVASKAQADVLESGRLDVTVRANRRATVKLKAHLGKKALSPSRRVRLPSEGRKRLGLPLSDRGERLLGSCGA